MKCPNCHSEVSDTSRFCADCGTKLGPEASPSFTFTRTLETPPDELTRGTVFAGRYEVIEELGRGGMGNVYRAYDRKIHEEIAIKFLKPEIAAEKKIVQRFSNELKIARRVSHHNVCRLHDLHEEGKILYITMEYVSGENLKTLIRRMGTLTVGKALSVTRQIAEGMAEAHKLGVVHRDLKPSNVMIDREGNAKIMDFGIARSLSAGGMTAEGVMIGTPEYMSPEQVEGMETDSRSDIYSLGVILYEMVTGHVPFEGDTPLSVAFKHKNEAPQSPRKLNPQVPESLNRLILCCLEKERSRRYQTAEEFLADLARVEEGLPTTERFAPRRKPITTKEITVKFTLRKLIAPAAFLGVIVVGFLAWRVFLRPGPPALKDRQSVAVITFENQTGDKAYDYLQDAIPNLLITSLEQSQYIRVASWERLRDLLKRLGRGGQDVIDSDLGFELCRMDGIQAIVSGSFVKAGNVFATDVKVLDVATKKILKTVGARGEGVDSILKRQIDDLSRDISRGFGHGSWILGSGSQPIAEVTTASLDAYNAFLRGRDEFEKYYYADAQKSLERAVALDPGFAMAHSYLWKIYTMVGSAEAARATLEKLKTLGGRAKGKEGLYIQALLASSVDKDWDKYVQILKKIITLYPEEKRCRAELGAFYLNTKKYDEAVVELKQAIALDPQYGFAINLLAYTYGYQNKFDEAIKQFELYASISPGDANPHDSMGDLYFRMGRFGAALEKYKEAVRIRPDFGSACRISYIYALTEDYPQAMKWIDDYIASAPSTGMQSVGHQLKAIYHYLFGNVQLALDDLDKAQTLLARENDNAGINEVYRARIWICYDWGMDELFLKFAKERHDFRAAHKIGSELFNSILYEFYLGLDDVRANRLEQAKARLAEIDKARAPEKKDPSDFWINNSYHFLLSEIELKQGRGNEAAESFKKMGETGITIGAISSLLQNNIPLINDIPARGWIVAGDKDRAVAEYERLTSPDPMARSQELIHPFSRLRLARLYEEKGERAKALAQYEKLAEFWKNADPGFPPVEEATRHLAALKRH
jgi:tetratricopeptide (TPR) repeat protein/tRNA A-37 threonylcarbamoyl transferase component Bud32